MYFLFNADMIISGILPTLHCATPLEQRTPKKLLCKKKVSFLFSTRERCNLKGDLIQVWLGLIMLGGNGRACRLHEICTGEEAKQKKYFMSGMGMGRRPSYISTRKLFSSRMGVLQKIIANIE